MRLDVAQERSLDAAVGEIEAGAVVICGNRLAIISSAPVAMLDLRWRKLYRSWIAVWGEAVDDGTAGVAEP